MHPENQSKSFVFTSNGERVDVSYFVQSTTPDKKISPHFSPEQLLAAEAAATPRGAAPPAPSPQTTPRSSRGLYPPQLVSTAIPAVRQTTLLTEPAGRGHTVF
jgi:hypothetical protein